MLNHSSTRRRRKLSRRRDAGVAIERGAGAQPPSAKVQRAPTRARRVAIEKTLSVPFVDTDDVVLVAGRFSAFSHWNANQETNERRSYSDLICVFFVIAVLVCFSLFLVSCRVRSDCGAIDTQHVKKTQPHHNDKNGTKSIRR